MFFLTIEDLLSAEEVAQLRRIAEGGKFVDGRVTNPANTGKNNLQLHDEQAYRQSSQMLLQALMRSEEFRNFAFPKRIAPPLMTKYQPGMSYTAHSDSPFINVGRDMLRTDLSATIFLADLKSYEGGALHVSMGAGEVEFRLPPGGVVVYPSDTLHQVTPVTRGARLAAITFIESFIANPKERELLYELNEVAALEGLNMSTSNFARLQHVQSSLRRIFSDAAPGGS